MKMPIAYADVDEVVSGPAFVTPPLIVTNLVTRDLDASAELYCGLCSFIVLGEDETAVVLGLAEDRVPRLTLIDWVSPRALKASRGLVEGTFLSILHEDVRDALVLVERLGLEIVETTPFDSAEPFHAIVRDFDGRVIELSTPADYLSPAQAEVEAMIKTI
jgi:hypothetical protein